MFERVVVTGSLAFDHVMSMTGRFADHILPDKIDDLNVSFIMNTFRQEFGGTAGNIAYSLGLLGIPTLVVASAGTDFDDYRVRLQKLETLDLSGVQVFPETPTARGFVTTDANGNQIWGFYEGAMRHARKVSLADFLEPGDFLVIAPNDPVAMMRYVREAVAVGVPYLFDPAFNIPHFSTADLKLAAENAAIIFGNEYEISVLLQRLKIARWAFPPRADQILVETLGAGGSRIRYDDWHYLYIPPVKVTQVVDPTGAGDAYRAGFLAGYIRGSALPVCGRMGALAAAYVVETWGTQNHTFTVEDFWGRFTREFGCCALSFIINVVRAAVRTPLPNGSGTFFLAGARDS